MRSQRDEWALHPPLVPKSNVIPGNPRLSVPWRGVIQGEPVPLSRAETTPPHALSHPRIAPRRPPVRVRLAPLPAVAFFSLKGDRLAFGELGERTVRDGALGWCGGARLG